MGKRETILEAALDIVSEQGVRALTLPALFERAHTGAGTFYHYFQDRSDLFDSMFDYCCEIAARELEVVEDADVGARERLERLCVLLFRAFVAYPREFDFMYWYSFGYIVPGGRSSEQTPSALQIRSIVSSAIEEGGIPDSSTPRTLVRAVHGLAMSAFWGHENEGFPMDDDAARRFADTVWCVLETLR